MNYNLIYNTYLLLLDVVIYFSLPTTSQVCNETVTRVSECPYSNTSEYKKWASEKCFEACGNSEGDIKYKYHCMLDSTYEELLEFCAIPKYLFGFCPAYDLKGQQIQKAESRPCNTTSSRTYYNSSELFFCDLTNCLESPTSTLSDSPSETTDMTTTRIPDGESWHHSLWIAGIALVGLIIGLIFFIWKRQKSSELSDFPQIPTPGENRESKGPLLPKVVSTP